MLDINDQLGVEHSIKTFIEESLGIPAVIHYNGIVLPEEFPFVVVRSVLSPHIYLSKARETIKTDMNFEITLYEASKYELTRRQDDLRSALLFADIPYFNRDNVRQEGVSFNTAVRNEYPYPADDITDKTRMHRVYFEVTVEGTHHKTSYKERY